MTVLMAACRLEISECQRHRKLKLIETLLENGANPEDMDISGNTCVNYSRTRSVDVRNMVDKYRFKKDI
jgi:hypothetical protein